MTTTPKPRPRPVVLRHLYDQQTAVASQRAATIRRHLATITRLQTENAALREQLALAAAEVRAVRRAQAIDSLAVTA